MGPIVKIAVAALGVAIGLSSHSALAQTNSVEIAGVRPGITAHGQVDTLWSEPIEKPGGQTFIYAPPAGLPGAQRVAITYFEDTTKIARIDIYLTNPVPAETARADTTLGNRTIVRENGNGDQEELYAGTLRGLILSSTGSTAQVKAMCYLSTRWLADLYAERFHGYMREKRYPEARIEADKAVAIDPEYARGYLLQGEYYQSQKNDDEAIVRFIAAAGAKYPPVYISSAHIYLIAEYGLKKKFADRAKSEFEKAVVSAENPAQKINAYLNYAAVLRDQKQDAEVQKQLNAALEVNPNSFAARSALGDYFWDKRDYRAAWPHYQALARSADEAASGMSRQDRAYAYFRAAYSGAEAGERDQAMALYQKNLSIEPNHTGALNNLALIYRDKGRLDEAIKMFQTGLAVKSADPYLVNNYTTTLVMAGRFEEARQQALRTLTVNPKEVKAMLNMARAWAAQGKKKEALEWLNKTAAEGYHDRNLATDKAFEKLHGNGQFQKLIVQMQ